VSGETVTEQDTITGPHSAALPYRRQGDLFLIELRLSSAEQLFDMRDPSPFLERDLDPDAEDYLLGCAREVPPRAPIKILIHAPKGSGVSHDVIAPAIAHFFGYRRWAAHLRLRELFRQGRMSLLIGVLFLVFCLTLSGLIRRAPWGLAGEILSEGLFIIAWVAMWRPLEIVLFDWWPIARLERLNSRLAAAPVEIEPI
jgi:hypothetical protein